MKLDFKDDLFKTLVCGILILFTLVNFYSLLCGAYITLLSIILQLSFLFFLSIDHKYQKYIGFIIFGLWLVSGIAGLTSSIANYFLTFLDVSRVNYDRLTIKSMFGSLFFISVGLSVLYALKKLKSSEDSKMNFSEYFEFKNISFKTAIRDAFIIRIVITLISFFIGFSLALIKMEELLTQYAVWFSIGEYFAILIFSTILILIFNKSKIAQSFILYLIQYIILVLINYDNVLPAVSTIYIFIVMSLMTSVYSQIWNKFRSRGSQT